MAPPISTVEPTSVIAGDTVKWTKSLPDYPASDGWSLAYTFINAAGKFPVAASADGDDYAVSVPPATTTGWIAGDYDWRAQVSKAGEVFTVATGRTTVKPSFGAATLDGRSTARKMLDAVEAVLENRASSEVAEYQINGRQLKYTSIPDLLKLRDRLRADVRREENVLRAAQGLPPSTRVFVRFGR